MVARLQHSLFSIATILTLCIGALILAASMVALVLFVFLVYFLVFQIGLANWSSLGVGTFFLALLGSVWLLGNSLLDILAGVGFRVRQRVSIILPWLGLAAFVGLLFIIFGN
jgi:hypothetical protein